MNRWLAVTLLASLVLPAPAGGQDSLADKRRELQRMQEEARANRARARELAGKETQALGRLRRTDRDLRSTRARLGSLRRRSRNLGQQLEMTRNDLQLSIQSLGGARERLRRRLRSIYKMGPARELEVMLSQQSFAQLMARWDFLLMVAEQDRQLVEDVRERKERVEVLETRLKGHLGQIEKTTRETSSQNQRLARLRDQRAGQVASIQSQRQSYEAAAAELERSARQLQQLLVRLRFFPFLLGRVEIAGRCELGRRDLQRHAVGVARIPSLRVVERGATDQLGVDLVERCRAVDGGVARAEQIQVRAVEYQDVMALFGQPILGIIGGRPL